MLPVRALSTQMYRQLTSNDCGTVSQSLFEMPQDTQAYYFSFLFFKLFLFISFFHPFSLFFILSFFFTSYIPFLFGLLNGK